MAPPAGRTAPVDWLIVGLGNPGVEYRGTPHNVGFEVAEALRDRWQLGKPKVRWRSLIADGRTGPGGPRVAVLTPQTFMNESGQAVSPARGELRLDPDRIIVVHDEIDLPFGEIRSKLGGGMAGHNGLKSIRAALGTPDFVRIRIGVGRPPSTDPERVAAYVLGRFREPRAEVELLIARAAEETERLLSAISSTATLEERTRLSREEPPH